MITLLIFLVILDILCICGAGISLYLAWRAITAFLAGEAQKAEYHSFMRVSLDKLQDSSEIFRSELARKMGSGIPEVRELNKLLINLENDVVSLRSTLLQYLESTRD